MQTDVFQTINETEHSDENAHMTMQQTGENTHRLWGVYIIKAAVDWMLMTFLILGRERQRETKTETEKETERERQREKEGGREGRREGRRKGGREGEKENEREIYDMLNFHLDLYTPGKLHTMSFVKLAHTLIS